MQSYPSSLLGRDPHLSSLALLLDFQGKNGATSLCDFTGKVSAVEGNAQISTARSRYGVSSGLFDGNNDAWSFANHADFDLSGAINYTVEVSVYLATNSGGNQIILNKGGRFGVSYASWALFVDSAGLVKWQMGSGGVSSTAQIVASTTAMATGKWYDVAVEKSGTNVLVFVNGTLETTAAITTGITNGSTGLWMGDYMDNSSAADCWNGNIGAVRITKGVARYPASYVPRPFPKC